MMLTTDKLQVVDEYVAAPKNVKGCTWEKIPLSRSHGELVKFDSEKDADFARVLSCIDRCLQAKIVKPALNRHDVFFEYLGKFALFDKLSIFWNNCYRDTKNFVNKPSRDP